MRREQLPQPFFRRIEGAVADDRRPQVVLGAAVAAHAFPLERGRPRLPDLVDTFFDVCRGEAGFYYWFKEWRNRDKVPRVRVVVARHMRESDFRRVAPPPPALPNALVEEL